MSNIKELNKFGSRWCIRCGNRDDGLCNVCYREYLNRVPIRFDVYCQCKNTEHYKDAFTGDTKCKNCFRRIKNDKIMSEESTRETL